MDRRDNVEQNEYAKELEHQKHDARVYNDKVTIDGKQYRVPYKMVKEATFSNVKKEQMLDMEHAARLQYRLMLNDAILRAKVEFVKQKITIVYNPKEAENRKDKISLQELIEFLAKEGVDVSNNPREERDFDYFTEMYSYHFDPPSIREHPPHGYTMDEWKNMRDEYYKKTAEGQAEGREKFKEWQNSYAEQHGEVLADKITSTKTKPTLKERIFGKKKQKSNEKGFWFHGV